MKNNYFVFISLILINYCVPKLAVGEAYKLPDPVKEGGMPLNEALNKRQSQRDYDDSIKITPEILSQALWSCCGLNREDPLKTTPSATGWYPLMVYIFLEDGVYKYVSSNHTVIKLLDGDYRSRTGTQTEVVTKACANFVFIGDFKKKSSMDDDPTHKLRSIYLDTGHYTMALYLFAAANNMKGVSRAMVDVDSLYELLGLNQEDYIFALTFSLGF